MSENGASGRETPEPSSRSDLKQSRTAQKRIQDAYHKVKEAKKGNTFAYKNIDYDKDIRVLKIYRGERGTTISGRLVTRSLFDHNDSSKDSLCIPYAALSYYWGEHNATHKIRIYDTDEAYYQYGRFNYLDERFFGSFFVQDNLFAALEQLRSPEKDVYIWADAVCIDQSNLKERTAQVTNMHEVYIRAQDVYIWLGPGEPTETQRTFDFLEKILDFKELEALVGRLAFREGLTWNEDLRDCKNVIALMKVDYFGRRWIIQELALATKAYVLQGQCSMPWSNFADAIALFMTKYDSIRMVFKSPTDYQTSRTSNDHHIRALDANALGANVLVMTTSNLFRRSKEGTIKRRLISLETLVSSMLLAFEATDPKDTIFAILRLAKDTYIEDYSAKKHLGLDTGGMVYRYLIPIFGIVLWKAEILNLVPSNATSHELELSVKSPAQSARLSILVFISYCITVLNLLLVWTTYNLLLQLANKVYISLTGFRDGGSSPAKTLDRRIEPDYQKCLRDVCAGFISYCIDTSEDKSKSLDILCRHWAPQPKGPPKNQIEMPSWILPIEGNAFGGPKQSRVGRVHGDSLVGADRKSNYTASGNLHRDIKFGMTNTAQAIAEEESSRDPGKYTPRPKQPVKEFPPLFDGTLEVKGFQLGVIEESESVIGPIISPRALKLCGWVPGEEGKSDVDRFWRMLVANRGPDGSNAPSWYRRACTSCLEWYEKQPEDPFNTNTLKNLSGTPKGKVEFLDRVQRVLWNRRVIRATGVGESIKPLFGLAPEKSKEKDIICIFYGCSVPVVIRPIEGTKEYIFLGESYIHEMMDGEAVEAISYKKREKWFKLR